MFNFEKETYVYNFKERTKKYTKIRSLFEIVKETKLKDPKVRF